MTERSLFNVACKIGGLWLLIHGISGMFFAFLTTRFREAFPFHAADLSNWLSAFAYMSLGLFFCARSSWITQFLFQLDDPLDEREETDESVEPAAGLPAEPAVEVE